MGGVRCWQMPTQGDRFSTPASPRRARTALLAWSAASSTSATTRCSRSSAATSRRRAAGPRRSRSTRRWSTRSRTRIRRPREAMVRHPPTARAVLHGELAGRGRGAGQARRTQGRSRHDPRLPHPRRRTRSAVEPDRRPAGARSARRDEAGRGRHLRLRPALLRPRPRRRLRDPRAAGAGARGLGHRRAHRQCGHASSRATRWR